MRYVVVGKIWVFEGDNGVGKTAVGTELISRLGLTRVSTPTPGMKHIRPYIHARGSNDALFFYYAAGNFDATIDIGSIAGDVLIDRFLASSAIDYMIREGLHFPDIEPVYEFMRHRLPQPTGTFLLHCDHDERVRRIVSRGELSPQGDNISPEYSSATNRHYALLMEREPGWHKIDTTNISVDEVVEQIERLIHAN